MEFFTVAILAILVGDSSATYVWSDCAPGAKIKFTKLNVEPKPVILPGDMFVSLDSSVGLQIPTDAKMNVTIEKRLFNHWQVMPCHNAAGTCFYNNPCHFLQTFATEGHCPPQLDANRIHCTCPFQPEALHLPDHTKFTVTSLSATWKWLASGHYRIRAEMLSNDQRTIFGCLQVEIDMTLQGTSCVGWLCNSGTGK